MKIVKIIIFLLFTLCFFVYLSIFHLYKKDIAYQGSEPLLITIQEGSNVLDIARELKKQRLISSEWAFIIGTWSDDLRGKFFAGEFSIKPGLSSMDIAYILTDEKLGRKKDVQNQITFPEGWTSRQMADRLTAKGFRGEEFFKLTQNPSQEILEKFLFLSSLPQGRSLEGFLFPDTYIFASDDRAQDIIEMLLETFEKKVFRVHKDAFYSDGIFDQNAFYEKVILASILEGEVRVDRDRKIVSGIFQKRLTSNMRLQSCATVAYALGERKVQYTAEDLTVDSPYNTYTHDGLPPGPVSNPSLNSLEAAFFPEKSEYLFFLNDPETGDTYFAKNFEEHKINKEKTGL
ncbi:MAG: endolytic transglycosylase MltG [Candidatus Moraniibacteriota bacterium]|nr:MAG: endolytic transglycosylase MltG [Candidatus Moranbacteria bacterium]